MLARIRHKIASNQLNSQNMQSIRASSVKLECKNCGKQLPVVRSLKTILMISMGPVA